MQTGTNGALGDPQNFAHGAGLESLDRAQEQHLAQFFRQALDFQPNAGVEGAVVSQRFDVDDANRIARCQLFAPARPRLGADAIEREPPDYPADPCLKALRIAQSRQLRVSADEGVLRDVLRVCRIAEHAEGDLIYHALILPHDPLEIIEGRCCHKYLAMETPPPWAAFRLPAIKIAGLHGRASLALLHDPSFARALH